MIRRIDTALLVVVACLAAGTPAHAQTYESLIGSAAAHFPMQADSSNTNGADGGAETGSPDYDFADAAGFGYLRSTRFNAPSLDSFRTTAAGQQYQPGDGNPFSFACWLKIDNQTATGFAWSFGNTTSTQAYVGLRVAPDNSVMLRVRESSGSGGTNNDAVFGTLTSGEWYHLVGTVSSTGAMRAYLTAATDSADTTPDGSGTVTRASGALAYNEGAVGGLRRAGGTGNYFDGELAGLAFWTSELAPSDVPLLRAGPVASASTVVLGPRHPIRHPVRHGVRR